MAHGPDTATALPGEIAEDAPCVAGPAFDAFARDVRAELVAYFRDHLPTDADAQDGAQESLLRLLRYQHEPETAWRPLLFRIASNLVVEHYRRNGARHAQHHVSLDEATLPAEAPEQEERVEQTQREALLRQAILALSPRSREIYLLSRVDGLTYPQIARRLDISVKSVEKSIARTVVALAEHVGEAPPAASK